MFTIASVILGFTGDGVLTFMPLPKERKARLLQQATGTALFSVGLAGFIAVVVVKGQFIG